MKTLPAILVGLMASLAIGVSTARGQMYSLEDLGVVKGMEASDAAAINNQGHVAGTAYKGEQTCAFHYDYFKKFMEDAGGLNSRGFGINSSNIAVGDAFFANPMEPRSHAAMFKGGTRGGPRGFERPGVQPCQWHQHDGPGGWLLRSRAR